MKIKILVCIPSSPRNRLGWYSMRYATSLSNATRYGYLLAAGAILAVSSNNRKSGNRRQVSHCFTVSTRAREAGGGLLACCRREVKHIPTTRPHGDKEGYRQMLVMCMRCYTRADDGQTVQQKGVCASKDKDRHYIRSQSPPGHGIAG
jgi:hypothetical protein